MALYSNSVISIVSPSLRYPLSMELVVNVIVSINLKLVSFTYLKLKPTTSFNFDDTVFREADNVSFVIVGRNKCYFLLVRGSSGFILCSMCKLIAIIFTFLFKLLKTILKNVERRRSLTSFQSIWN